jgi:ADP-ribose pyrophosphatase
MSLSNHSPARWEKRGDRSLACTRVLDLREVRYCHPIRKTERDFIVINAPSWVVVVALTADGRLVLVNQFRFGIDGFSVELPGGAMDPGEDPVTAGVRELREETGFIGPRARLLGSVHPNPAIQSNRCHFVLVEQAARVSGTEWDQDEEIEITTLPVAEVFAGARSGLITHALALNALLLFEPHWTEVRKSPGV